MADCPYCDEWRYDPTGAPVVARPVGKYLPVVWDGGQLRGALGSDAPNGRHLATGRHVCEEHPMEPDVLRLGPVRIELI